MKNTQRQSKRSGFKADQKAPQTVRSSEISHEEITKIAAEPARAEIAKHEHETDDSRLYSPDILALIAAIVGAQKDPGEAVSHALAIYDIACAHSERAIRERDELLQRLKREVDDHTKFNDKEIALPQKFPATLDEFLNLVVCARTPADGMKRFRDFVRNHFTDFKCESRGNMDLATWRKCVTKRLLNSLIMSSGFAPHEFGDHFTTRSLIAAITKDGITVPKASSEIQSLNDLLREPSLHSRFPRTSLPEEAQDLVKRESTLNSVERTVLNRYVLEAAYPRKCPEKASGDAKRSYPKWNGKADHDLGLAVLEENIDANVYATIDHLKQSAHDDYLTVIGPDAEEHSTFGLHCKYAWCDLAKQYLAWWKEHVSKENKKAAIAGVEKRRSPRKSSKKSPTR